MEINHYFQPIDVDWIESLQNSGRKRLGDVIVAHTSSGAMPDPEQYSLAIIGVPEDRGTVTNMGCAQAPDEVRKHLYRLFSHWNQVSICDLGNLKNGHRLEDTYFAFKEVVAELVRNKVIPIVIGGSQDLTYANYLAYENVGRVINIAAIDPMFDLGHDEHELNSQSYLSRIILHQPNFLFNYTNIGYQTYFVDQESQVLMKNLYFDVFRLGNVRANMEEVEPMVRNADILSIDLASIRHSEAPASEQSSPNGFYGEEMCQICRYAGLSDKLTSIGFYELNPSLDHQGQSAFLYAQMIWYFIDGFVNRQHDFPEQDNDDFVKFTLHVEDFDEELLFLKSKKSSRWWMVVGVKDVVSKKYRRHQFVPCSYDDYQAALNQEIPDRWWKVQQKLM
ncbi:MAG: arginase [Bacteroidetes bacterium HGW-Bacteroidetes-16]|jgi:arginase family enzyme|nr:MAG: arginase [Bacteroidetes bacterium HGW-Bacteroidetes-16]